MVQTKEKMVIDGVKTQVACFPELDVHADGDEAECWTAGWGQVSFGFPEDPLQLQTRDPRTAWSEDRSVRLGPRFSKIFWSWSGSVRDFSNFVGPGPVRSEIF